MKGSSFLQKALFFHCFNSFATNCKENMLMCVFPRLSSYQYELFCTLVRVYFRWYLLPFRCERKPSYPSCAAAVPAICGSSPSRICVSSILPGSWICCWLCTWCSAFGRIKHDRASLNLLFRFMSLWGFKHVTLPGPNHRCLNQAHCNKLCTKSVKSPSIQYYSHIHFSLHFIYWYSAVIMYATIGWMFTT